MSDDTIRLVTIGRIFRRRRRLLTLLALVGALVGYGTSLLFPPRYTTSASILLPGAWQERELLTQAQIATSSVVVDRAAAALGWKGVDGDELREQVAAQASEGNIIKISGTAETPERAQRLADQVARQFVTFAARVMGDNAGPDAAGRPEELREMVAQAARRITELSNATDPGRTVESVQARTELTKLRTALQEAADKLEQADPATDKAGMVVMGPAPRPTAEAPPTTVHLVAGGAVLFVLVAVICHLTAARTSRRLRTGPEMAAALRSVLLGTVDVPVEGAAYRPETPGPRARIRRLLGTEGRWNAPAPRASGDETGQELRYRRVHARLRDRAPGRRRLLVVVPDGDELARRAAGQLVLTGAGEDAGAGAPGEDPALRVVRVAVLRPTVPDREDEAGALVVLSSGNWTAEELSGIAEACADAGHELVGTVLADPVRARPARAGGRSRHGAKPVLAAGHDATGSSG
ncbi:Wzz/FepE/Etk N-terminal domain-containing protein [Streptomyces sp. NPDC101118]|uniref:Wzz/FepE/Etk N-terminal domain-containing protein n=1 Tax=Streptomyces sp. NPDC101118 TaxID=3366109 RepID=UPI0037FD0877